MGCVCLDDYFIPSVVGQSQGLADSMGHLRELVAACWVSRCGGVRLRCDFTQAVRSLCGNLGLLCIALGIVACHLIHHSGI